MITESTGIQFYSSYMNFDVYDNHQNRVLESNLFKQQYIGL